MGRNHVEESTINVAKDYNQKMNGVDITDQFCESFRMARKSNKWWKSIFWWSQEELLVCSYLCYKEYNTRGKSKEQMKKAKIKCHRSYRDELIHQMVDKYPIATKGQTVSELWRI